MIEFGKEWFIYGMVCWIISVGVGFGVYEEGVIDLLFFF